MNDYIKIPLALFVATAISATLITTMHNISEPILEDRTKENLDNTFKQMYGSNLGSYQVLETDVASDTPSVYQVELSNGSTETVFEMVETGKNGPIKMLISYDQENTISNLNYLEISETPGIGMKVSEEGFVNAIIGQKSDNPTVDGISGATISSTAVKVAVENSSKLMQTGGYNE